MFVKSSASGCCLAFAQDFANFSLTLLLKVLLIKKACISCFYFVLDLAKCSGVTQLSLKVMLTTVHQRTSCRQKKSEAYTKMVGMKVKSCITTTNLENTTFPSMTEHQTKPNTLMVLNLFCCKILCTYLCLSISVSKSCHIVINIFFDCLHPAWGCS